jgi:hypothetical protein
LQGYALFPWRTVRQNIEYGLEIKKIKRAARKEISDHFIDLVDLKGFENSYPYELSGDASGKNYIGVSFFLQGIIGQAVLAGGLSWAVLAGLRRPAPLAANRLLFALIRLIRGPIPGWQRILGAGRGAQAQRAGTA